MGQTQLRVTASVDELRSRSSSLDVLFSVGVVRSRNESLRYPSRFSSMPTSGHSGTHGKHQTQRVRNVESQPPLNEGSHFTFLHGLMSHDGVSRAGVKKGGRVRQIDESELQRIYCCVDAFLVRHRTTYLLDSSDLADIRQDTVVSWWQYVRQAKNTIPPEALARLIARRRLFDFIRKERRCRERQGESVSLAVESSEPVLGSDTIFEEIHALPGDESILVLKRIEGHTFREIAREQAVHERTIRSRWAKVRSRLRKRLSSRLKQDHDDRLPRQLVCV